MFVTFWHDQATLRNEYAGSISHTLNAASMMCYSVQSIRQLLVASILGLGLFGAANGTQAQDASSGTSPLESTSRPALDVQSSSPSASQSAPSLNPYRSLEKYVQEGETRPLSPSRLQGPTRRGAFLNRGGKVFWGMVGLATSILCNPDSDPYTDRPGPLLESYGRTCVECERIGERAADAMVDGLFSSDS